MSLVNDLNRVSLSTVGSVLRRFSQSLLELAQREVNDLLLQQQEVSYLQVLKR